MWVEHDSGDELWIHGAVISTLSEKPISTSPRLNCPVFREIEPAPIPARIGHA